MQFILPFSLIFSSKCSLGGYCKQKCCCRGIEFQIFKIKMFWRSVSQQCEYTYYWTVHLKLVKMINFILYIFLPQKKQRKNRLDIEIWKGEIFIFIVSLIRFRNYLLCLILIFVTTTFVNPISLKELHLENRGFGKFSLH